jgi:asparagine synthase (glutamine-hydrolysing)
MCGIAGFYQYKTSNEVVQPEELLAIREAMVHRGPDDEGLWISRSPAPPAVGLAHRRLAILDTSPLGKQPMQSSCGNVHLVFNGEIYNFQSLRSELANAGHSFRSGSDTEVLLALYLEHGIEMVDQLRGMYAFSIYDARSKTMYLVRDPFGVKPLYYADSGSTLRFASEVRALLKCPAFSTDLDPAGSCAFFLLGHVPEPHTLFQGIRQLPAGSILTLRPDRPPLMHSFCAIEELWFDRNSPPLRVSPEERLERFADLLKDSLRHHLVSDVPTGFFLSSGRDSASLVGLAAETHPETIASVTLGFDALRGGALDETSLAEVVATQYQTKHSTVWITKNDFLNSRERFLAAMDQPTIDGLNTYFVSQAAVTSGLKVAISGLGADEMLGGYPGFNQIPKVVATLGKVAPLGSLGKALRIIFAPILQRITSPKYAGVLEYGATFTGAYLLRRGLFMPWELSTLFERDFAAQGWEQLQDELLNCPELSAVSNGRRKVAVLESTRYMRNQLLRDTDWASMAHSLEVRVPFVDLKLLKGVLSLLDPTEMFSKHELTECVSPRLPDQLLSRPKTGFTTPVREWLLSESAPPSSERGLRGWARLVYAEYLRTTRGDTL